MSKIKDQSGVLHTHRMISQHQQSIAEQEQRIDMLNDAIIEYYSQELSELITKRSSNAERTTIPRTNQEDYLSWRNKIMMDYKKWNDVYQQIDKESPTAI